MIDLNLTKDSGLDEIGHLTESSSVEITDQTPVTQAIKEARDFFPPLYKEDKIYQGGGPLAGISFHSWNFASEQEVDVCQMRMLEITRSVVRPLNILFNSSIKDDERHKPSLDELLSYIEIFKEMVVNAIEHGTHFCEEGSVDIEFNIGEKGWLTVISQPTPVPCELIEKLQATETLMYTTEHQEPRGSGLTLCVESPYTRVGFQTCEDSFSVILLTTWE